MVTRPVSWATCCATTISGFGLKRMRHADPPSPPARHLAPSAPPTPNPKRFATSELCILQHSLAPIKTYHGHDRRQLVYTVISSTGVTVPSATSRTDTTCRTYDTIRTHSQQRSSGATAVARLLAAYIWFFFSTKTRPPRQRRSLPIGRTPSRGSSARACSEAGPPSDPPTKCPA